MSNEFNGKNYALLCDVDMTLLPSMSTDVPADRRALADKLHTLLGGAFALVTGRPADSLDESFPSRFPASVEHHSAWRPTRESEFLPLSMPVDSEKLGSYAENKIRDVTLIFTAKQEVLEERPGIFVERKKFSLALVFSPKATPNDQRAFLKDLIGGILNEFNLSETHRLAEGSDAVELVPQNLCKGEAVRNFMNTEAFRGKTPIFIGDGLPDAKAMQVCAEEFGGFGVAVGHRIPDAPYIKRRLDTVDEVWNYLENLMQHMERRNSPSVPRDLTL
ncbi:MAG: HAD-IIB family hydrolase [Proteobacteria bacterium]|nr:HAD-IIB family hydrolase [Pseudomonadota bacterium]